MAVKWLVIGIGDITRRRVIPAIQAEPHSELYGVVTRDPRKAEAYQGVRVWTALPAALEDPAVDAVYVASPVALHAPQTIASLRAGKHVLCEKPAAMSHAEAESMTVTAYSSGRQFGVAYYRRFFPKLVRAKQLIAEGALGTPVLAEANCHSWLPGEDRNWLLDPAIAGAGPLFDIGSHRIDALNFLFGRPARVSGMLSNAVHQLEVEDSATVLIDYPEGVRGVVDVRWNSQIPRDQFRVIGTDGEINLDPLSGPTLRCGDRQEELPPHPNVHYPSIENFAQAVLNGTPLEPGGEEAIWTDWVMDTLKRRRR